MKFSAILVGAFLFAFVHTASATVYVQHSGSTNPGAEGFTNDADGLPVPGSAVAGPPAAWNINSSWCCDYSLYTLSSSQITALASENWTLTAVMQNLSTETGAASGIYADVLLDGTRFDIELASDGAGNQLLYTNPFNYPGLSYTISGLGTNYATIQMTFDHLTNTVDYYVDGTLAISDSGGFSQGGGYVLFGGVDGNFSEVSLTSGVPEPSTWVMMLIGFAGLGYAGYRQTMRSGGVASTAAS